MKRYGDNLPSSTTSDAESSNEQSGETMVMYGGCGVSFGAFTRPTRPVAHPEKERKFSSLLALLGFKRNEEG